MTAVNGSPDDESTVMTSQAKQHSYLRILGLKYLVSNSDIDQNCSKEEALATLINSSPNDINGVLAEITCALVSDPSDITPELVTSKIKQMTGDLLPLAVLGVIASKVSNLLPSLDKGWQKESLSILQTVTASKFRHHAHSNHSIAIDLHGKDDDFERFGINAVKQDLTFAARRVLPKQTK